MNLRAALGIVSLAWLPACRDGCSRRAAEPPTPAPQSTRPVEPQTPATPPGPATPPAPATPTGTQASASTPCVATPAQPFHLRPTAVVASVGPELPGGTALEVLGVAEQDHRPMRRGQQVLLRVRTATPVTEGYTFVGRAELSTRCPVVWPSLIENPSDDWGSRFTASSRAEAITRALHNRLGDEREFPPDAGQAVGSYDLDGDGVDEEVIDIDTGHDTTLAITIALFRSSEGFSVITLGGASGTDHPTSNTGFETSAPLRFAGAVYIPHSYSETTNEPVPPLGNERSYSLSRCRLHGPCPRVFTAYTLFVDEVWTFTDAGNGAVRITSSTGASQTLRWNADAWRLAPEAR
jgi:hypothetical protein